LPATNEHETVVAGFALFFAVHPAPARANDLPADVSVKGEYAKIFMYLGGRIRENAALAANCRQETRDWAEAIETDEKSKSSASPSELPEFGRRYDFSSIVGNKRYFSVIRMSATEIDGAYNAIETVTFLWDSKTNDRISLARFFDETEDGGPTMRQLFAEATTGLTGQIGKDKAAALIGTLRPSLDGLGAISLAPSTVKSKTSGLNFHYAVPVPGLFHLKEVVVFVPWTKFKRHLSPQGRSIFGGNWHERYFW
jgi:hypothetical protein